MNASSGIGTEDRFREYFLFREEMDGQIAYSSEKILSHFNQDGTLKGEGKWRAKEIFEAIKAYVISQDRVLEFLRSKDMDKPLSSYIAPAASVPKTDAHP
jgi:hypothetical protein